jgi:GTPase Era involved in 16S rRNA processing
MIHVCLFISFRGIVRHLWQDYICDDSISAILFVIDAADSDRIEEAGYELDALISENLVSSSIPVALLLNKCDLSHALDNAAIGQRIDLSHLESIRETADTIRVFRISVLNGTGYDAAFQWISTFL